MDDAWRSRWLSNAGNTMRQVYFRRATGELPEMESSKAAAARVRKYALANDCILDVGCGAGHYLRSLRSAIDKPFSYTGIDATSAFLELAQKANANQLNVTFRQGDIFSLPFENASFDIVMSNNVLLHLPSIDKPIRELCRVARRHVIIRTLVGERTFRIQEVHAGNDDVEEFNENGEPKDFNFFSIYSKTYVAHVLSKISEAHSHSIDADMDFDPERIKANPGEFKNDPTATQMLGNWQRNGYILLPWAFIDINIRR